MADAERYRRELAATDDRQRYLLEHSGLPGPRGNLELAAAAVDVCPPAELSRWAELDANQAPTGTAEEYLAFCGVLGLRRGLVSAEYDAALCQLRGHASDPRWRVREAVAMALQFWGSRDFDSLARAMAKWADGAWLERRAAAAALCEPALLTTAARVRSTLAILTTATSAIILAGADERRADGFVALRKGLGYCWSVAAAAAPALGLPAMDALIDRALETRNRDLHWIARENLRKKRLERIDAGWVNRARTRLEL